MINKTQREKLYTGFGVFLPAFRSYIISFLKERAKDEWLNDFEKTLGKDQKRNWDKDLRRCLNPEDLIDFSHFQSFAEDYRDLLKRDFPGKNQSLPTWLLEIAAVRNKLAHHVGIEEDEAQMVWIRLRAIVKFLGKIALMEELSELEKNKTGEKPQTVETEAEEAHLHTSLTEVGENHTEAQTPKRKVVSKQSNSSETLDIVNCANAAFRKTVLSHKVYLCPAKGGAYNHKQCKYLGVYWGKRVGAVAEIEAVVDVHSEDEAEIYLMNEKSGVEGCIAKAEEKALQLRPDDFPIRVFLLKNLYSTDFIKDSPGGMFGSKIYFNLKNLEVNDAEDLAAKLQGKKYSDFGL